MESKRLQQLVQRKQKERNESFEELRKKYQLTSERITIVELPVEDLIQKLQTRELKALAVLEAYTAKALEVTGEFNCVTEFVPQAWEWAQDLDDLPQPAGPLHGLPIAIKDDTTIEGMDTSMGYAAYLFQPAKESCVLVQSMRHLGAIPFCKTNIPQTEFSFGSDNPTYGTTTNCLNKKLSPGGSSSGSGCIVGAGGAPVSEGTDIGGSVRIPAHFNGISTLRPTSRRLSMKGIGDKFPNIMGILGVPGMFAKQAKTLATIYKCLLEGNLQHKMDPLVVPVPWRSEIFESRHPLRIGYFTSVPIFPAMGDTEETVLNAKTALESLGHTLVPFQLPDSFKYSVVINNIFFADGGKYLKEHLKHEEIAVCMETAVSQLKMPSVVKSVMGALAGVPWLPFHSKRAQLFSSIQVHEPWQLWDEYGKRNALVTEILDQMETSKLDLILGPVFPFPACRVDDAGKLLLVALGYTSLWNLVDFPAGVVKFGKESGTKFDSFDNEGDMLLKLAQEATKDSVGMPIGVTLVGKPFQEELILRAMVELETKQPAEI